MVTKVAAARQGIQSIEIGLRLIRVLVHHGRPMMLKDLAAQAGMPAAKAHRYLVSFMRTGLVEQDVGTSRYDLGAYALEVGTASLARLDPVRLAGPVLEDLCEKIQETVALAVWGTHGATIVRWADIGSAITVSIRAGAILPLMTSATGRAFSAFSRLPAMRRMLDDEIKAAADATKIAVTTVRRNHEKILAEAREHGIARTSGSLTPGINGFSAPVFDHTGTMMAAVTSLGAIGHFDTQWDSPLARAMREAADELSTRLGYTGTPT
jgi:DNA-binding IclR family transcriptional regulator